MDTLKDKLSEYISKNYSLEEAIGIYKELINNETILQKLYKEYDNLTYDIIVIILESEKECKENNKYNIEEIIKLVSKKLDKSFDTKLNDALIKEVMGIN